jgi:transposase InsO family protein
MEEQFEMIMERRNDPSKFYLISRETGFTLRGGTINKLFHVWEPKSSQFAFITTRSMAKRPYDDDDDEDDDENNDGIIQKVGNENFLRESSDPQPIRDRHSSPKTAITNSISPKRGTSQTSVRHVPAQNNAQPSIKQPSISALPSQRRSQSIDSGFTADNAIIVGPDEDDSFSSGDFNLWHRRLGHTSYRNLYRLGLVPHCSDPIASFQACDACAFAKQTRLPYRKYEHDAPRRLWRVHSDMSGIQEPSIVDGYQYFITFIDDYSRYCWVYFTKRKDAATIRAIYGEWQCDAVNKANKPVSFLQTDGGGEYQADMAKILKDSGTTHLLSPPYSHESNGLAERQNRTLKDTARTLMRQANMPSSFWPKAIKAACDIRNRLPHMGLKGITCSPHHAFFKAEPVLQTIQNLQLNDIRSRSQRTTSQKICLERSCNKRHPRRISLVNNVRILRLRKSEIHDISRHQDTGRAIRNTTRFRPYGQSSLYNKHA